MSTPIALLYFFLALALSLASSVVLSRDVERLGRRLAWPEPLMGVVTAFAADSPEISSAIVAVLSGRGDVGAGVVYGSNVYNVAALLGVSAIVSTRVRVPRAGLVAAALPAIAITAIAIPLTAGSLSGAAALAAMVVILAPYVAFTTLTTTRAQRLPLPRPVRTGLTAAIAGAERGARPDVQQPQARSGDWLSIVPALASVALASVAMVHTLTTIGDRYGISSAVIGMLILATVTGLPNLVAAITLARHGRGSAVVSEALNSNSINIVVGLGVPALAVGLPAPSGLTTVAGYWLLAMTLLALGLTGRRGGLSRREGIAVVGSYLAFVVLVLTY